MVLWSSDVVGQQLSGLAAHEGKATVLDRTRRQTLPSTEDHLKEKFELIVDTEKYLNPVNIATIAVAIGTLGYTLWDGERSNSRENDLSFSQFAAKISRLEVELEQLNGTIRAKEQEVQILRQQVSDSGMVDTSAFDELAKRVDKLEKNSLSAANVTPEQVAEVLIQNFPDAIRGPQGPQGPAGPKGEPGPQGISSDNSETSSSGKDGTKAALIDPDYSSDFPKLEFGTAEATLIGCEQQETIVQCAVLLEETSSKITRYSFRDATRVALPSAEWVENFQRSANGLSFSNREELEVELSPGIPTRVEFRFKVGSARLDGLLGFEARAANFAGRLITATWRDIRL
jgi:hypothetical protein